MAIIDILRTRYINAGFKVSANQYIKVADFWLQKAEYQKAENVYSQMCQQIPNNEEGYRGLLNTASKTKNWKQLSSLLTEAIEKYPKDVKYVILLIVTLNKSNSPEDLKNAINKFYPIFPKNVFILKNKAKLLRADYKFQEAQEILDILAEKKYKDFEFLLMYAQNLKQIGNFSESKKVLESVKPLIDYSKRILPNGYTKTFIEILTKEADYKGLKLFFEECLNSNFRNLEIILGYSQILVGLQEYEQAISFMQKMISESSKLSSPLRYSILLFELEKIKNTQKFDLTNEAISIQESNPIDADQTLETLKNELHKNPNFENKSGPLISSLEKLNRISSAYNAYWDTPVSPKSSFHIANFIIEKIQKATPLSLIRLGDGEGNFLPYDNDLKQYEDYDRECIQKLWWGTTKIDKKQWANHKSNYHEAIFNADILGIPGPRRLSLKFLNYGKTEPLDFSETRGLKAILDFLDDNLNELTARQINQNRLLTSCHLHTNFEELRLWDMILKNIKTCSVISCHQALTPLLKKNHGIEVRDFYRIPSEFKFSSLFNYNADTNNSHYPNAFETICNTLEVKNKGEVFLVAAGFLGKIYCDIIKQQGGIALDIGSTADYWLNHQTRIWSKVPNAVQFSS